MSTQSIYSQLREEIVIDILASLRRVGVGNTTNRGIASFSSMGQVAGLGGATPTTDTGAVVDASTLPVWLYESYVGAPSAYIAHESPIFAVYYGDAYRQLVVSIDTTVDVTSAGTHGFIDVDGNFAVKHQLHLCASGSTEFKTIFAGGVQTEDIMMIWPSTVVENGYLKYNSGGLLSWSTAAGGGAPLDVPYLVLSSNGDLTGERILQGTANQILLADTGANGTLTLSLPQSINIGASPEFAGLTLTGLSGVLKTIAGAISGSASLYDLSNISGGAPANGYYLKFNSANNMWYGAEVTASGGSGVLTQLEWYVMFNNYTMLLNSNVNATNDGCEGIAELALVYEAVSSGELLYVDSAGHCYLADADAAGKYPATAIAVQSATGTFGDRSIAALTYGKVYNAAWNWTIGATLYLDSTAGGITETAPVAAGLCIQKIGYCVDNAHTVFFTPSLVYELVHDEPLTCLLGDTTPQLGGNLDPNGKLFLVNTTMGADHTAEGLASTETAGENLVFGDIVYDKSDGKVWKADANAAGLFPATGVALGTINTDATGAILRLGMVRDDTYNWTIGAKLYLSTTAGALTATQPTATDDCIQVLATCRKNADTIWFNPSPDYFTHV
jgi:hypothetical protein